MADNTTKGRINTMTTPSPQADAPQEQLVSDPAPGNSPLEQAKNEAAGVLQKTWDGIKNGFGTLKDATGLGVSPEIAAEARQRVLDGAKGIAKDAAFKVGGGGSSEERAGKAQAQAGAIIDDMRQAYERNAVAGMVGALATKMVIDKVVGKVGDSKTAGADKKQADREAPKDGVVVKAPLRAEYEAKVRDLQKKEKQMRESGKSDEEIARELHKDRRALGVEYKDLTPPEILEKIYTRNLEKYGDKLGPTIEWLQSKGKSWTQIIESATRTGGKDLGL
jgi:hypothetical protein